MSDDSPVTPSDDTAAMHRHAEERIDELDRRLTDVERGVQEQRRDRTPAGGDADSPGKPRPA